MRIIVKQSNYGVKHTIRQFWLIIVKDSAYCFNFFGPRFHGDKLREDKPSGDDRLRAPRHVGRGRSKEPGFAIEDVAHAGSAAVEFSSIGYHDSDYSPLS